MHHNGSGKDWLDENFFTRVTEEDFFKEYQGKKCLKARLSSNGKGRLPTWKEINSFLSNQRLTHPRTRMALEGATSDQLRILIERASGRGEPIWDVLQNRVYSNLRSGGTLVLDAIDTAFPSIQTITASIARRFYVKPQANAYITFGKSRGFGLHWDDHDVFIVQIYGKKQWNMYGFTRAVPMHKDYHGEHDAPTKVLETIEVRKRHPKCLLTVQLQRRLSGGWSL